MFVQPQTVIGPPGGALRVAVTPGPDFGQGAGPLAQGVVVGHPAVFVQAHHLAVVVVQGLGVVHAVVAVAQGQVEQALRVFHDAAAEMVPTDHLGLLAKQHLPILDALPVGRQGGTGQGGGIAVAIGGGFGIADEQAAVAGKVAVAHHVQQPPLATGIDGRQPRQGWPHPPIRLDNAQAARPLAHQPASLVQKGQRPGMGQALGDAHRLHRRPCK